MTKSDLEMSTQDKGGGGQQVAFVTYGVCVCVFFMVFLKVKSKRQCH